jgi:hypothetical protein
MGFLSSSLPDPTIVGVEVLSSLASGPHGDLLFRQWFAMSMTKRQRTSEARTGVGGLVDGVGGDQLDVGGRPVLGAEVDEPMRVL